MARVYVLAVCLLAGFASHASAQDRSVWGFSASFVPQFQMPSQLAILFDVDDLDVSGNEFRAGVVRGRPTGGDWGVSFVRKKFKDDSVLFGETSESCFGSSCFTETGIGTFQNVTISGIEAHRFFPFATIKRRAQIGLTVAGGVGAWKGSVHVVETLVDFVGNTPVLRQNAEDIPIEEIFVLERRLIPLFRLELGAAVIASDNFKLRVGGGINFPGTQTIGIQAIFLLPQ